MKLYDHTGIIHIHSAHSFDGRIAVQDIIRAANEQHIDFLMLTDHGTLQARDDGMEDWHGDTLLIVGQEISPRFNHYLAFEAEGVVSVAGDGQGANPQAYIREVHDRGGFGFIAHPDHQGAPMFHVKHYPWTDWGVTDYAGVGIWDFMTDWQNSLTSYGKALCSYLWPFLFLRGPKRETLERWDSLNRQGRVVGIAECDNHDTLRRFLFLPISVFPFKRVFKYLRTHILTESPLIRQYPSDKNILLSALTRGRVYVAQEYFAPAKGFTFTIHEQDNEATIGDVFALRTSALIEIALPRLARILLLRDGCPVDESRSDRLSYSVDHEGVYRVEVYLKAWGKERPWIFSNPIYVQRA